MSLFREESQRIQAGTPPLSAEESGELAKEIPDWTLKDEEIERVFSFGSFRQSIEFVNRIAEIAEKADHHPDICIYYNKVQLVLSTHKIGGLSRNDFIVAAKADRLFNLYDQTKQSNSTTA
jgi:4a-hydroxytetrahydrobiopterin dehydratase